MKRAFFILTIVLFLVAAGSALAGQKSQQGYGQGYGPQGQGWFCPWCGQDYERGYGSGPGMMHGWGGRGYGMGPGMMQGWGRRGYGMGPGMMHGWGGQGYGMGPGMMQDQWGRGEYGPYGGQQQMEPLSRDTARELAENYVAGNPNLKIGELTENQDSYEASVVTKDGSLVEKLLIDKNTGWMKRTY